MSQLAVQQPKLTLTEIETVAANLAASGYFSDAKQASQAYAKILAGQELGVPPFASMANIYIVQGKSVVGAGLMASKIKQSAKYDYRVIERSREAAEVEFYENGQPTGRIRYTAEDAKADGNTKGAWVNHRDNMLFKTCITKGYRTYCPDVFDSAVYIYEEMGLVTDGDDNVIDVQAKPVRATQVAQVAATPAPVAAKPQTITKRQVGIIAEALEAAKFPEDKEQRRDFIISVSGCEPVDAASQISYDCAQRVIDRIQSEGMDNLLAAWEAECAMEQEEAGQPASTATITPEEVAKLALDLGELIPEGSTDFVDTWLAANCPDVADIYGLSHAEAMSLLQAAREYSALEAAA